MRFSFLTIAILTTSCMQYRAEFSDDYSHVIKYKSATSEINTAEINRIKLFTHGAGDDYTWGTPDDNIWQTTSISYGINGSIENLSVNNYHEHIFIGSYNLTTDEELKITDFLGIHPNLTYSLSKISLYNYYKYGETTVLADRIQINSIYNDSYIDVFSNANNTSKSFVYTRYSSQLRGDSHEISEIILEDNNTNMIQIFSSPGVDKQWETGDDLLKHTISNYQNRDDINYLSTLEASSGAKIPVPFDENYFIDDRFSYLTKDNYRFVILNRYAKNRNTNSENMLEQYIFVFDTSIELPEWKNKSILILASSFTNDETQIIAHTKFLQENTKNRLEILNYYTTSYRSTCSEELPCSWKNFKFNCPLLETEIDVDCIVSRIKSESTPNSELIGDRIILNRLENGNIEYSVTNPYSAVNLHMLFINESAQTD